MIRKYGFFSATLLLGWAGNASAQAPYPATNDSGDTAWVMIAAIMVLLLAVPGLALIYSGAVRTKNALTMALQCGSIAAAVSLLWVLIGYTIAFGPVVNGWFGGGSSWMLNNLGNFRIGLNIPESTFALFEMSLAIFAAVLMTGAWSERARPVWVVTFAALWSLLIYAPIAHWVWGGGWLGAHFSTVDFSGGIVIHVAAGVSALVVALLLGKRSGFPFAQDHAASAPLLSLVGGLLLWGGWLAMSGGSGMAAVDDTSAAIINTHLAACAGALVALICERATGTKPTPASFIKGALAGLVAIAAASAFVSAGASILIGAAGSALAFAAARFVRGTLKIDDAMDIFATHAVSGAFGALAGAVFITPQLGGTGYGSAMDIAGQVLSQAITLGAVIIFAMVGSAVLALAISLFVPMRVSEDQENDGLDALLSDTEPAVPAQD